MTSPNSRLMSRPGYVGLAIVVIGLVIAFVIVPWQTRTLTMVVLQPSTLPMAYGIGIALCGLGIVLRPVSDPGEAVLVPLLMVLAYVLIVYFGMRILGYAVMAPAITLALMLYMKERRPFWLIFGGVVVPVLIWFIFAQLLGRALP